MKNKIYFVMLFLFLTAGCGTNGKEELLLFESENVQTEAGTAPTMEITPDEVAAGETTANESAGCTDSAAVQQTVCERVVVHVCGAVLSPGVYELSGNSLRVVDAIAAAGGMREDASEVYLNQAAPVMDGQRIYVPTRSETEQSKQTAEELNNGMAATAETKSAAEAEKRLVNLNTASREELMTLPGVGEAKADSILKYRETAGAFQSIEDIMQVQGIKEGMYNKIKELITIDK